MSDLSRPCGPEAEARRAPGSSSVTFEIAEANSAPAQSFKFFEGRRRVRAFFASTSQTMSEWMNEQMNEN